MERAGRSLQSSLRGKGPRARAPETPRSSSLPKRSDSGAATEEMRAKPWPVIHIRGSGGSIAVDNFIHREPESSRWMAVNVGPKGSSTGQLIVPELAKGRRRGVRLRGLSTNPDKSPGAIYPWPGWNPPSRTSGLCCVKARHSDSTLCGGREPSQGATARWCAVTRRACLPSGIDATSLRHSLRLRPAGAERHGPRREPIEVRKATLASILRKSRHGVRLNEHLARPAKTKSDMEIVQSEAEYRQPIVKVDRFGRHGAGSFGRTHTVFGLVSLRPRLAAEVDPISERHRL